jgi:protein-disulfide isomerase
MTQAQIGESPEQLLTALQPFKPKPAGKQLYRVNNSQFFFEVSNGRVHNVTWDGKLNAQGVRFASALIGAATGYGEGLAQPVAQFLNTRVGELAGQGEVTIPVEEYALKLIVSGKAPHQVSMNLRLPEVPENVFPETLHALGPRDAKYVIREFSDFQCPFCKDFSAEMLPQIKEVFLAREDVRFEFHHFPLESIHANAFPAAEAAECVTAANKPTDFWTYHDALFERQQAWQALGDPTAYFVRLAADIGLSEEGVRRCLDRRLFADEVRAAYEFARGKLELNGTPTVFVNGYQLANFSDIASFEKLFEFVKAFGK